jgi:hypothetical protein
MKTTHTLYPLSGVPEILFSLFLILIFVEKSHSQASVSGVISNYGIPCSPVNCEDDGPSNARYYYVAPVDGTLEISGFASPGTIFCCGNNVPMTCTGSFRRLRAGGNIHVFGNSITTGSANCIMAGDSIEINFSGSFGSYGYTATVIPAAGITDPEPNNIIDNAYFIEEGNSYSGHIGHGFYQLDAWDFIGFEAPEYGKLSINITHTDDTDDIFQIGIFRNDGIFIASVQPNTSPFLFEQDCLATGDTIYLRVGNNTCMSYFFDVNFLPPTFGNDFEPNDDFSSALQTTNIVGSVGHQMSAPLDPDRDDFYELPQLSFGDELTFNIEVVGGPVHFKIRSASFPGFTANLGVVEDQTIVSSFQPTNFEGIFYLEATANTGNCGDYKVELSGCVQELVLSGSQSEQLAIESNGFIQSTQQIESVADISYDALDFVLLNGGFQVKLNAIFHAFIDGCE